jgi:hypothetical protein
MARTPQRRNDRADGGSERRGRFKGGKRSVREKRFGVRDVWFWRWYHREKKSPGSQDAEKQEIVEAHREWESLGKPRV